MSFFTSFMSRAGLAALTAGICLGQMKAPEVRRPTAERPRLDQVTNWPAPLYWRRLAPEARKSADAIRPEDLGAQGADSVTPQIAIYVAVPPCRLLDSRTGQGFTGAFGPPSFAADTARLVPVPASSCGVPAAVAYSVNITAVPAPGTHTGYVKAWPDDEAEPNTAVLNDTINGAYIGNSAIVPAGADGGINVLTQAASDLVIDINGYFADPSTLPMALGAGSAAAPALTFGSDPTTGLFSTGAGSVSIATNGVNALTIGPTGNLDLPGSITKGGTLFLHNLEASGLPSTSTGVGLQSLSLNGGRNNTAMGSNALALNAGGVDNTAVGARALASNTSGNDNAAVGDDALMGNTQGSSNTAIGSGALRSNSDGTDNTAVGALALYSNTGSFNLALGVGALNSNTTGNTNTALGSGALSNNGGGSNNIAIGRGAGYNVNPGNSNNIHIGTFGAPADSGTIRLGGNAGLGDLVVQTQFFASGVRGVTTGLSGALPVVIDSNGQLGTVSSSRTVKRDIADMGDTTETLMSLRPVQFRYTAHGPDSPLQYGLIAEEVAEVAPELVARKASGEVETVFYDKVNAMLLNEVQKLHRTLEEQQQSNSQLRSQNEALKERSEGLAEAMRRLEARLAALEGGR